MLRLLFSLFLLASISYSDFQAMASVAALPQPTPWTRVRRQPPLPIPLLTALGVMTFSTTFLLPSRALLAQVTSGANDVEMTIDRQDISITKSQLTDAFKIAANPEFNSSALNGKTFKWAENQVIKYRLVFHDRVTLQRQEIFTSIIQRVLSENAIMHDRNIQQVYNPADANFEIYIASRSDMPTLSDKAAYLGNNSAIVEPRIGGNSLSIRGVDVLVVEDGREAGEILHTVSEEIYQGFSGLLGDFVRTSPQSILSANRRLRSYQELDYFLAALQQITPRGSSYRNLSLSDHQFDQVKTLVSQMKGNLQQL